MKSSTYNESKPSHDAQMTSFRETSFRETSFRATPSGFSGSELVLSDGGDRFGTLVLSSPGEISLPETGLRGKVEKRLSRYRLDLGDTSVTATRRRGAYELRCGNSTYEAKLNPMKNSAQALAEDGSRIEVRGGILKRSYDVVCEGRADGLFEVAVLLLYMTATSRRRAFTA